METENGKTVDYDNGGWAKHQLMVMALLESHTTMLKDLSTDINSMKRDVAIATNDTKNWRDNINEKIVYIRKDLDSILNDDEGLTYRVKMLENGIKIDQQSDIKFKGSWALIGGIFVIVIDILAKALEFFIHKP